jgi:lysophospholipase L1-like esterase
VVCHQPNDLSSPFAAEFRAFAAEEARGPLPANPVLFYGSSSIRLWETLPQDFPGLPLMNRGFGGSTLADCVKEMDRLVVSVRPRAIVFYGGENDLDQGATPEKVLQRFQRFAAGVRSRLGPIPLMVLTIKPSPSRFSNIERILRTNDLLRQAVPTSPPSRIVDVFPQMLGADERPNHAYFCDDWLHLSPAGYRLWTSLVREALRHFGLLS